MLVIHDTYGIAAAAIDTEDGPSHPLVRSEITMPYDDAVAYNSSANSSQAAAAVTIGPEPGPVYIKPELISGGKAAKSNTHNLLSTFLLASSLSPPQLR